MGLLDELLKKKNEVLGAFNQPNTVNLPTPTRQVQIPERVQYQPPKFATNAARGVYDNLIRPMFVDPAIRLKNTTIDAAKMAGTSLEGGYLESQALGAKLAGDNSRAIQLDQEAENLKRNLSKNNSAYQQFVKPVSEDIAGDNFTAKNVVKGVGKVIGNTGQTVLDMSQFGLPIMAGQNAAATGIKSAVAGGAKAGAFFGAAQEGVNQFKEGKFDPLKLAESTAVGAGFGGVMGAGGYGLAKIMEANGGKIPVGMSVDDVTKSIAGSTNKDYIKKVTGITDNKVLNKLVKSQDSAEINNILNNHFKPTTGYHVARDEETIADINKNGFNLKNYGEGSGINAGDAKGVYFFPSKSSMPEDWADVATKDNTLKRSLNIRNPYKVQSEQQYFDEVVKPATKTAAKTMSEYSWGVDGREQAVIDAGKITGYLKKKGYDAIIDKEGLAGVGEPQIIVFDPKNIKAPGTVERPVLPGEVVAPNQGKTRGLVGSVKGTENPNVSTAVREQVKGNYIPQTNEKLMGEAKALMTEGASINLITTKNIDQKIVATMQEAINQDKAGNHQAAANLWNNLADHATELGRAVQSFNMLKKMSPEAISLSVAGQIKKYNLQHATKQIPELSGEQQVVITEKARTIFGMKKGRAKNQAINEFNTMISDMIPSSWVDKGITIWKAGLLTSLRTHERNLIGNTGMLTAETIKDIPAVIADKAMSLKTGERSMSMTLRGLREFGSQKTRQEVADIVFRGDALDAELGKFDTQHITWGKGKIEQGLKKYTDTVFNVLGAEDKPFYNAAFARSLYDQAGAAAKNAGRSGDMKYIKKLVDKPTEEMLSTATKDASYATFHDKNILSKVAGSIKRAAKSAPGAYGEAGKIVTEVMAPFTGVPSSIAGKALAYSPLGLTKGAIDFGRVVSGSEVAGLQRQAAQEIGRGVVGTGLFGLGAYLMSKGLMTGQPKDKKEADLWAAQGKQPNSVFIGGKWRNINSIGPQELVILAGAKAQEEAQNPNGPDYANLGFGLAKDQLSQTFLAGVQGPLNAVTDPKRYGESYIGNQAASVVPNIFKDMAKASDPVQRENNNVGDYIQNSLPYFRNHDTVISKANLPKRDVLGNEMKQEPTGWRAFVDVFNSKTPINDPVANELGRLNMVNQDATPSVLSNAEGVAS